MFKAKFLALPALVGSVVMFTACPSRTSISRINGDPARYRDKEVGVSGRVVDSYGAIGTGAYQLDDGTGKIWVVSRSGGVPTRGARISAQGRVYQGLSFAGRNFGTVIEESDRRVK